MDGALACGTPAPRIEVRPPRRVVSLYLAGSDTSETDVQVRRAAFERALVALQHWFGDAMPPSYPFQTFLFEPPLVIRSRFTRAQWFEIQSGGSDADAAPPVCSLFGEVERELSAGALASLGLPPIGNPGVFYSVLAGGGATGGCMNKSLSVVEEMLADRVRAHCPNGVYNSAPKLQRSRRSRQYGSDLQGLSVERAGVRLHHGRCARHAHRRRLRSRGDARAHPTRPRALRAKHDHRCVVDLRTRRHAVRARPARPRGFRVFCCSLSRSPRKRPSSAEAGGGAVARTMPTATPRPSLERRNGIVDPRGHERLASDLVPAAVGGGARRARMGNRGDARPGSPSDASRFAA